MVKFGVETLKMSLSPCLYSRTDEVTRKGVRFIVEERVGFSLTKFSHGRAMS
jgi:hypothetical protein